MLKVEQMHRTTFIQRLGTVGGTLGLFSGLSLLSMIEVVYWFYLGVLRVAKVVKRNKEIEFESLVDRAKEKEDNTA